MAVPAGESIIRHIDGTLQGTLGGRGAANVAVEQYDRDEGKEHQQPVEEVAEASLLCTKLDHQTLQLFGVDRPTRQPRGPASHLRLYANDGGGLVFSLQIAVARLCRDHTHITIVVEIETRRCLASVDTPLHVLVWLRLSFGR